jgi:hypothetical protein
MEYIRQRGTYVDVPYDEIRTVWFATYRRDMVDSGFAVKDGDFHAEAAAERE